MMLSYPIALYTYLVFFFQAEDGIRDYKVTGVQTCALPICLQELAEIRPERLAEVAKATGAKSAVTDYRELLKTGEIEAVYISATPETTHYRSEEGRVGKECRSRGWPYH